MEYGQLILEGVELDLYFKLYLSKHKTTKLCKVCDINFKKLISFNIRRHLINQREKNKYPIKKVGKGH